jgi:hypothetical protein
MITGGWGGLPQQLPRLGPGEHIRHPVQLPPPGLDLLPDLLRHIVKDHRAATPPSQRKFRDPQL